MKRDLYIDCDGVIFDTIKYAFNEMRRLGVDLSNDELITKYFKEVDWNNLITKSGTINDSINKINLLKESDVFDLVCVLTHRCSWNEGIVKDQKFDNLTPNVKVITIPRQIAKHYAVNARGHFLIDDDVRKVTGWVQDGGIGILFSQSAESLIEPYTLGSDQTYFITNNLLDLLKENKIVNEEKSLTR